MDQADEINLIRHRRQMATDSLLGEKFAIKHGAEDEPGARFSTMDFQSMVTSALTGCLIAGDHPRVEIIRQGSVTPIQRKKMEIDIALALQTMGKIADKTALASEAKTFLRRDIKKLEHRLR